MNDSVITIPTLDDFIKRIDEDLTGRGFSKDTESLFWSLSRDMQEPPRTVIVNGQRHDQPGETHHIVHHIEVFGEGVLKDDTSEEGFAEVNLYLEEAEIKKDIGPTFCIPFDDYIMFESIVNEFLNN